MPFLNVLSDIGATGNSQTKLYRMALLYRLRRGLTHRINNVATALMIAQQEVGGAEEDARALIGQGLEKLILLANLFSVSSSPRTSLTESLTLVHSIINGIDHRVGVTIEESQEPMYAWAPQDVVIDSLLLVSLSLHLALGHSGLVNFSCAPVEGKKVALVVSASQGNKPIETQPEELAQGKGDLALARRLVEESGGELITTSSDEGASITLAFRAHG